MDNIRKVMLSCTTSSFWVCMINDRVLFSKRGVCAWRNKCGAVRTFKASDFWIESVGKLRKESDIEALYTKLLENGTVRFIEVCPVPEKCC
jgi:hypothetical protein